MAKENCLLDECQEAEGEGKGQGGRETIQSNVSGDTPLPIGLHLRTAL